MSQPQYDYQQGQQYGYEPGVQAGLRPAYPGADDRTAAVLAHASSLIAMVITAGWLSFVGPLLMWVIYKDRSPFVRQAAAGSFNFNLGLWVMSILGWVAFFTVIGIPVALVLWGISFFGQIIGHAIGVIRASRGESMNYPFQLRVLR